MLVDTDIMMIVVINLAFFAANTVIWLIFYYYLTNFMTTKIKNTFKTMAGRQTRVNKGKKDDGIMGIVTEYGPLLLDLRREGYSFNEIIQLLSGKDPREKAEPVELQDT